MAPPDFMWNLLFQKKGQTVWISPEDNDGLGMGISMPTSEGERADVV